MSIPRVVAFEGLNEHSSKWTWRRIAMRCPNPGEYFMSGAIPMAYKARQHLTTEYLVVEPVSEYTLQQAWLPK